MAIDREQLETISSQHKKNSDVIRDHRKLKDELTKIAEEPEVQLAPLESLKFKLRKRKAARLGLRVDPLISHFTRDDLGSLEQMASYYHQLGSAPASTHSAEKAEIVTDGQKPTALISESTQAETANVPGVSKEKTGSKAEDTDTDLPTLTFNLVRKDVTHPGGTTIITSPINWATLVALARRGEMTTPELNEVARLAGSHRSTPGATALHDLKVLLGISDFYTSEKIDRVTSKFTFNAKPVIEEHNFVEPSLASALDPDQMNITSMGRRYLECFLSDEFNGITQTEWGSAIYNLPPEEVTRGIRDRLIMGFRGIHPEIIKAGFSIINITPFKSQESVYHLVPQQHLENYYLNGEFIPRVLPIFRLPDGQQLEDLAEKEFDLLGILQESEKPLSHLQMGQLLYPDEPDLDEKFQSGRAGQIHDRLNLKLRSIKGWYTINANEHREIEDSNRGYWKLIHNDTVPAVPIETPRQIPDPNPKSSSSPETFWPSSRPVCFPPDLSATTNTEQSTRDDDIADFLSELFSGLDEYSQATIPASVVEEISYIPSEEVIRNSNEAKVLATIVDRISKKTLIYLPQLQRELFDPGKITELPNGLLRVPVFTLGDIKGMFASALQKIETESKSPLLREKWTEEDTQTWELVQKQIEEVGKGNKNTYLKKVNSRLNGAKEELKGWNANKDHIDIDKNDLERILNRGH